MTVQEAISHLRTLDPKEHIIINWWVDEEFEGLTKDQWEDSCQRIRSRFDWSLTQDMLQEAIEITLEEKGE